MTFAEFILLHPDFTNETLLRLFEKVGVDNIMGLYGEIDYDHHLRINDLYRNFIYSYFSLYWIIKQTILYQIRKFIFIVLFNFLGIYIENEYFYIEVIFIFCKELALKDGYIAKTFINTFVVYLFDHMKYDGDFLLILHRLLEENFLL